MMMKVMTCGDDDQDNDDDGDIDSNVSDNSSDSYANEMMMMIAYENVSMIEIVITYRPVAY